MATPTYTKTGNKASVAAKLKADIFDVKVESHELLKQAYKTYLSNGRTNLSVVKTRGLVSGGGRKPWKQKGTGRARFGSIRNPIWRGGGIVFGPTGEENFTKKLNVAAKRLAIRQALSLASQNNEIIVIEAFEPKDGKTNSAAGLLNKVGAKGKVLIVTDNKTTDAIRAVQNLKGVALVNAKYLNVYDLLNSDSVVMTKKAVEIVQDWLAPSVKEAK